MERINPKNVKRTCLKMTNTMSFVPEIAKRIKVKIYIKKINPAVVHHNKYSWEIQQPNPCLDTATFRERSFDSEKW